MIEIKIIITISNIIDNRNRNNKIIIKKEINILKSNNIIH